MSWIQTVPDEEATGRLKGLYDKIRSPDGALDHIMMAHILIVHVGTRAGVMRQVIWHGVGSSKTVELRAYTGL